MKGRKRHIVVDTIGLLLVVVVHSADIQERDGAKLVLRQLLGRFPRLRLIWADGSYAGELVDWAYAWGGWLIEVVKRTLNRHSFAVLPWGGWAATAGSAKTMRLCRKVPRLGFISL